MMLRNRLKYLWPGWRRREEREMREELESLIAIAESKELGNLTLAMENVRATWGWTWLGAMVADIRYSLARAAQPVRRPDVELAVGVADRLLDLRGGRIDPPGRDRRDETEPPRQTPAGAGGADGTADRRE